MDTLDDVLVPILRRLIFRIADRENWRRDPLLRELSHFAIAKCLSE